MSVPSQPNPAPQLVGNPKRVRGLDASMLSQPAPRPAAMVGNPRRTRGLRPEDFRAA